MRKNILLKNFFYCFVLLYFFMVFFQPVVAQETTTKLLNRQTILSLFMFVFLMYGGFSGYKTGLILQVLGIIFFVLVSVLVTYVKGSIVWVLEKLNFTNMKVIVGLLATLCTLFGIFLTMNTVHAIISKILRLIFMHRFNKILGGFLGIIFSITFLECLFCILDELKIAIPQGLILSREEVKYLADKVSGLFKINIEKEAKNIMDNFGT